MLSLDHETLSGFPAVVTPKGGRHARDLVELLTTHAESIPDLLDAHGALLFRGFDVRGAADFEPVCEAGTPGLLHYTGGGSIRSHVAGKVYTSTEYSPDQHILLHCESTYFQSPPRFIWLHCEHPPTAAGETPIGDMGRVLARLDPAVVERFAEKGVRYSYNLHDGKGFGRGWREAFGTDDRGWVESWLERQGAEYFWREDGALHMDLDAPALRTHDRTGEQVWGNQAVNWHIASLAERTVASLRRLYGGDDHLPKHATFGDGTPIADADVRHIIDVLRSQETAFPWQRGDVLLCDNQRIAHGRRPFAGERRVLVALA